ncbi:MAG: hypothetical protein CMC08_08550 [Flavobacteriaceae bacterium]|nr:hypothetical protein [Flavobacteriaceae bacterium]
MRKDITIPEVKEVYIAAVQEFNADFNTYDWNAYIINNSSQPLETVLIVSHGLGEHTKTTQMRHALKVLPSKNYAKIEFLEEQVFSIINYFSVTYFTGNTLFDKRFEFPANSIVQDNTVELPVMGKKGVLAR